MIRILPKPQHIEEQEGTLLLDYHCRITIEDRCPRESLFYAQQLAEQIKKMTGIELGITGEHLERIRESSFAWMRRQAFQQSRL